MLFRNNPKVYLTINHGDSSSVNPRTKLARSEPRMGGRGGAFLISLMDPICVDNTRGNRVYFRHGKPEIPTPKSQRV